MPNSINYVLIKLILESFFDATIFGINLIFICYAKIGMPLGIIN